MVFNQTFAEEQREVIQIDHSLIGIYLGAMLQSIAGKELICISDLQIKTTIPEQQWGDLVDNHNRITNIASGIQLGLKLFDLLAYFSIEDEQKPRLVHDPACNPGPTNQIHVGQSLYAVYLYLLLRGAYPTAESTDSAFVAKKLASEKRIQDHCREVCSFDLHKFGTDWIQYVKLEDLDDATQNRLALGMAGYRLINALFHLPIPEDTDENLVRVVDHLNDMIKDGPVWFLHPCTRQPDFVQQYGNFNRNLVNLIYAIHGQKGIDYLKQERIIPNQMRPTTETNYASWPQVMVPTDMTRIYTSSGQSKKLIGNPDIRMIEEGGVQRLIRGNELALVRPPPPAAEHPEAANAEHPTGGQVGRAGAVRGRGGRHNIAA